jgi:hypothetical protein
VERREASVPIARDATPQGVDWYVAPFGAPPPSLCAGTGKWPDRRGETPAATIEHACISFPMPLTLKHRKQRWEIWYALPSRLLNRSLRRPDE